MSAARGAALLAAALLAGLGAAPDDVPRLSGTLIAGTERLAIFVEPSGSTSVAEGDRFGAYIVRSVRPGLVELAGPQGELFVRPTADHSAPAEPAPAAPAAWPVASGDPISDK